ncbi:hypothetical protein AgCh_034030 [Apium graveolens]
MRESAAIRYKGFGIPMDWMLDTGYVTQNYCKSMMLYLRIVLCIPNLGLCYAELSAYNNLCHGFYFELGTSGKSLLVDGIDDKGFSTEAHGCAIIEVLGKDKHNEVLATLHKV